MEDNTTIDLDLKLNFTGFDHANFQGARILAKSYKIYEIVELDRQTLTHYVAEVPSSVSNYCSSRLNK